MIPELDSPARASDTYTFQSLSQRHPVMPDVGSVQANAVTGQGIARNSLAIKSTASTSRVEDSF